MTSLIYLPIQVLPVSSSDLPDFSSEQLADVLTELTQNSNKAGERQVVGAARDPQSLGRSRDAPPPSGKPFYRFGIFVLVQNTLFQQG